MFVLNVLYVQFNDTYLMVYIPAALMAAVKETPRWSSAIEDIARSGMRARVALACLWTRSSLVEEEAFWQPQRRSGCAV